MMTNLIFNAVDAMPDGGTLTVRSCASGGNVVIDVVDTGTGMTAEVRARCLDPFFSTKGEDGTGLGLAMVFGIVQRQQGHIDIESAPGVGTTFRITLPANAHEAAVRCESSNINRCSRTRCRTPLGSCGCRSSGRQRALLREADALKVLNSAAVVYVRSTTGTFWMIESSLFKSTGFTR
jgi:hypothetical protein